MAEIIYSTKQIEHVKVTGRDKSIILQSNRPYLRGKGLKHRRPDWKLIQGEGKNVSALERIITAIMRDIDK